jgi:hypothetical protein
MEGTQVLGLTQIVNLVNHRLTRQAAFLNASLFALTLLALFVLLATSSGFADVLLVILFVASPIAAIAAASRACRVCSPEGSDWLAMAVTIGTSALAGIVLAKRSQVTDTFLKLVSAIAWTGLIGQLILLTISPKFCPICLFSGALLQAILFSTHRAWTSSEFKGICLNGIRPVAAVVLAGILSGAATWAKSPTNLTSARQGVTLKDVQAALIKVPLHGDGVVMLAKHGCGPCEEALSWLVQQKQPVSVLQDASTTSPIGWDPAARVVTPTFVFYAKGKPSGYIIGFPTAEDDQRRLLATIRDFSTRAEKTGPSGDNKP